MKKFSVVFSLLVTLVTFTVDCHAGFVDMSTGQSFMRVGKIFSPGKSLVLDCLFEKAPKDFYLLVRADISADAIVPGKMNLYHSARISIAASGGFRGYQNIFIEGTASEKTLYFLFRNYSGQSKLRIKIENYSKSGMLAVEKLDFILVASDGIGDLNYDDESGEVDSSPVRLDVDMRSIHLVPVERSKYGFNSKFNFLSFNSVDLLNDDIVEHLSPGIIRFPGGTDSNFYRFEYDGFDKQDLMNFPAYIERTGYKVLFDKYKRGGQKVGRAKVIKWANERGAEFILVLNIFSYSPEEATRFIDRVLSEGGRVSYVELGNEVYFDSQRGNKFNNVYSYLGYVKRLIPILRSRHPNVKIGIPINEKNNKWNKAIAESNIDFDACILHPYFVTSSIFSRFNDSQLLDYAKKGHENIIRITTSLFPGKKVWITEYNIYDRPFLGNKFDSSLGAIFSARAFLTFINSDDVELACFHALLGHALGLINVPFETKDSIEYSIPLWFWGRADDLMQPGWESAPVSLSEDGSENAMLEDMIDLQYYINKKTGDKVLLAVNASSRNIDLKEVGFGVKVESLVANTTDKKFVQYKTADASSSIMLPPMSINFIY